MRQGPPQGHFIPSAKPKLWLIFFFFLRDSMSLKPRNYFPLPLPAPSPILCSNFFFPLSLLSAFPCDFSSPLYPFSKTPFLGSFPTESESVTGFSEGPNFINIQLLPRGRRDCRVMCPSGRERKNRGEYEAGVLA